ncbi:hypothetical protein [Bacillus sp. FJAT-47783]|nr:hypothetical protein [Bacillus sp. FJAT-47783]
MKHFDDRKRLILIGKKQEVLKYLKHLSTNDTTVLNWLNEQKKVKNQ